MNRRAFLLAGFGALTMAAPGMVSAAAPLQIADDWIGNIILTEIERRLIQSYYRRHYDIWVGERGNGRKHKNLPPGLAKKGTLPPGLAMQLVRNGSLPPGLAWQPLPRDLVMQLPHRPPDQRLVIVDDKVMLVRLATNLILDVLTVAAIEAIDD